MTRRRGFIVLFVFICTISVSAGAVTTDFRIFFDADHDIATGCNVAGMPGVDEVLVTRVVTDDTSGRVTTAFRQVCVAGTLGAPVGADDSGWPARWDSATGNLLVETRIPFAALGADLPRNMRIGVQATQDAAVHTALTLPNGDEVYFPLPPHGRRRAVGKPGEGRIMRLDGLAGDWELLTPVFDGIAASGVPALRILKVFAYADTAIDFIYFRFDANLASDAPYANDDHYTRPSGAALSVPAPGTLANDGDPDGLPLTATPVSTPAHGTLTLNPDGSFTYTPADASSTDADSFEYKASNGIKDSNAAQVHITVAGATNSAPIAVNDSYSATEDTPLSIVAPGVLQNDTDADSDPLTAALVTPPANGTVVLNADGGFTYTPGANYAGNDSFSYSVSDGTATSTATVTLAVAGVNDAPSVHAATFSIIENSPAGTVVGTVQVLDPDDTDTHSFSIVGGNTGNAFAINPSTGQITVATPSAINFEVTPQFTLTVRATDNGVPAEFDDGTITINVTDVNDVPAATPQSVTTAEDTPVAITLAGTDEDGDPLTYAVATAPAHGSLTGSGPNLTYTPAADYNGPDSFTFRVNDGTTNSGPATVSITIAPVDDAPVAVADAGYAVSEGATLAGTSVLANDTDVEGDALTAVLVAAPAHSSAFTLNANGTFTYTHDGSETVADSFSYRASDGTLTSNIVTVSIAIAPVNDAPVAVADSGYNVAEGGTLSGAASVLTNDSDAEASPLTAVLVTGPAHGTLTLLANGTFSYTHDGSETTTDSFTYMANDGTLDSNVVTVTISITPSNDAPVFTSPATASVPENTLAAASVTTSDAEGDSITYSITGGVDAARFAIDSTTGVLTFIAPPDFEAPSDSDSNNVYVVEVTANDGTATTAQTITITVTEVNEAPEFTSSSGVTVAENTTAVSTVSATDPEGNTVTYSITGGADAALFSINATSGVLTFGSARDYEAPADADANNGYVVEVTATDGTTPAAQTITVTVTDVNEAPTVTSSATVSVAENITSVTTVTTSDPEGNSITYSITGGADAAKFAIGATTGALSFSAAPDFEAPADSDVNNVYVVEVTATDGTNPVVQTLTVTVTDANEAPVITSGGTVSVMENNTDVTTVTASDPEGDTVTFSITGGADAALFSIDGATGVLTLNASPNYEAPADADANNEYLVQVTASDGTNTAVQNLTVTIIDRNEEPTYTSSTALVVAENVTAVGTLTATDPENDTLTWSVTGGVDAARFAVDPTTGALTFTSAPDFEAPSDADANNVYAVEVTVTDGSSIVTQALTVTVTNVNEAPVFTSAPGVSVVENTTAAGTVTATDAEGDTLTYSITGGADASRFSIGASTGALTFNAAPNFEAPADSDGNNVYEVDVTVSDGTTTEVLNMTVTVTNADEAPVFTSTGAATVPENTTGVMTVSAADPEGTAVSYSITGGADASKFSIDGTSGALSFNAAPDFEMPGDAGANNVYDVDVTATDGVNSAVQSIAVTVADANDPPYFTSSPAASAPENSTTAATVSAVDPESQPLTYSITGGDDASQFSIVASTGVLSFNTAPDFESPTDLNNDNVYGVEVTVTDGTSSAAQNLSVTVTNVNEAPSFTSTGTATVSENSTTVTTVTTTDPEADTISYSVTGGPDASLFAIDSSTGVLTFSTPPDFENPTDLDANNVYVVQVTANDGANNVDQTITVTVTDYDEAPEFTSAATANVPENTTAVMSVTAADPEMAAVTYAITGGTDAAKFSLDVTTGALAFASAPNFEAPTDTDTNNVYVVEVTATDATSHAAAQTISVTVTNVNEAPVNTLQNAAQSVDEDTALTFSAANSNLVTISDPDSGSSDVQTTLAATNGNITLNAAALAPLTSVTGNTTGTVVLTGTVSEINAAMAGMSFKGTQDYNGSATLAITTNDLGHSGSGGAQSDGPDSIAITVNPVNDAPIAEAKTHATHSAIGLTINAATNTGELKENATDVDDAFSELTVQLVPGSVSPANATVTLTDAATGSFYFEPPGGYTGAATFQYKVCDDNVGDPNQCSAATTVTVNVGGQQLWFIDDTDAAACGAGCTGSRTKPLVGLNTANAAFVGRGTGDRVFVFSGSYPTGYVLAPGEHLVGQGASNIANGLGVTFAPYTNGTLDALPSSGAAPTIGGTLTAATGSYARGLAISSGASKGYVGSAATDLTVSECSVTSASNTAVELSGATGTTSISFTSTNSSGGSYGINLTNVAGTLAFGSGTLTGHTTASFALSNSAANTPSISYGGNLTPATGGRPIDIGTGSTNSGMRGGSVALSGNIAKAPSATSIAGIRVQNSTGGTLTLSGTTIDLPTATSHAVELATNPGATFNFNPGTSMSITTTTGRGFLANGGGTINVTGSNNTISTSSGTAFEVYGVPAVHMGGSFTFKSITSTNGTKGITLQYHDGAFNVTGDGNGDSVPDAAGAGGTVTGADIRGAEFIQVTGPVSLGGMTFTNPADTAGPDPSVATGSCGGLGGGGNNTGCFAGIHFDTVSNVTLRTVNVSGSGQIGINGNAVTNLTMNTVNVSNSGNVDQEDGIRLYNLTGTAGGMTNVNVTASYGKGLHIENNSGSLASAGTPFVITSSNFQNSTAAQGAVLSAIGSSTLHVKFVGGTISGNYSNGIQTLGAIGHSGTLGIYVDGTAFSNNTSAVVIQASGGTTSFDVRNITHVARGTNSSYGIGVKTDGDPLDGYPDGVATGSFINNQIGNASAGSGASCGGGCSGISGDARNNSSLTITIQSNTVRHVDMNGIFLQGGQGGGKVNATIVGNTIQDPDNGTTLAGIYVSNGVSSGDTSCTTAQIGGTTAADKNSIIGSWGISGIRVVKKFTSTTFNLPGYAGAGTDSAAVDAFIAGRNLFSGVTTTVTDSFGGAGFSGGPSCP